MPEDLGNELKRMVAARRSAATVHDDWMRRTTHWRLWKRRLSDYDAMARGEFHVVFPNERGMVERPKIPNIVQLKLDDLAQQASHAVFSMRCEAANERGKARAEKRERIAAAYALWNNVDAMRAYYLIDLAGTGTAFRIVLPDFDTKRPCIKRVDPRFAFPDTSYSPDRGMNNLLVAYKQTRAQLIAEYPELETELRQNPTQGEADTLDVLEYYDSSELIRCCIVPGRNQKQGHTVELIHVPNLIKRAPIAVAARPSHDFEPRGVFDQVLGVLNAENRVQNLLIDGAADWLSSPVIEFDAENPEDWGTGSIVHIRSKDGYMRRMTPAVANQQVFMTLQEMKGDARAAAVYPEVRSGIARQSIVSAAGLNALGGTFDSEVAALLRMDANATAAALSLCFEIDETYFPEETKYIQGSVNGGAFSESYTPQAAIKGDYGIRIEVPGAGEDPFQREIRLTQQASNGLIPKRLVMEQLTSVKDVLEAERLLDQEQLKMAGMAFIQQQASQGNFAPAAAYLKALEAKENPLLVLASFSEIQQGQAPGAGNPLGAFQEANALSRGGLQGAGGNVPGVGQAPQSGFGSAQTIARPGLPPLSSVLVR